MPLYSKRPQLRQRDSISVLIRVAAAASVIRGVQPPDRHRCLGYFGPAGLYAPHSSARAGGDTRNQSTTGEHERRAIISGVSSAQFSVRYGPQICGQALGLSIGVNRQAVW